MRIPNSVETFGDAHECQKELGSEYKSSRSTVMFFISWLFGREDSAVASTSSWINSSNARLLVNHRLPHLDNPYLGELVAQQGVSAGLFITLDS